MLATSPIWGLKRCIQDLLNWIQLKPKAPVLPLEVSELLVGVMSLSFLGVGILILLSRPISSAIPSLGLQRELPLKCLVFGSCESEARNFECDGAQPTALWKLSARFLPRARALRPEVRWPTWQLANVVFLALRSANYRSLSRCFLQPTAKIEVDRCHSLCFPEWGNGFSSHPFGLGVFFWFPLRGIKHGGEVGRTGAFPFLLTKHRSEELPEARRSPRFGRPVGFLRYQENLLTMSSGKNGKGTFPTMVSLEEVQTQFQPPQTLNTGVQMAEPPKWGPAFGGHLGSAFKWSFENTLHSPPYQVCSYEIFAGQGPCLSSPLLAFWWFFVSMFNSTGGGVEPGGGERLDQLPGWKGSRLRKMGPQKEMRLSQEWWSCCGWAKSTIPGFLKCYMISFMH